MKPTRRTLLVSALPALVVAQTPPVSQPDYYAISIAQTKRNADALANVPVAMDLEPAFQFKP